MISNYLCGQHACAAGLARGHTGGTRATRDNLLRRPEAFTEGRTAGGPGPGSGGLGDAFSSDAGSQRHFCKRAVPCSLPDAPKAADGTESRHVLIFQTGLHVADGNLKKLPGPRPQSRGTGRVAAGSGKGAPARHPATLTPRACVPGKGRDLSAIHFLQDGGSHQNQSAQSLLHSVLQKDELSTQIRSKGRALCKASMQGPAGSPPRPPEAVEPDAGRGPEWAAPPGKPRGRPPPQGGGGPGTSLQLAVKNHQATAGPRSDDKL